VDVGGGLGSAMKLVTERYTHIRAVNFDQPHVISACKPMTSRILKLGDDAWCMDGWMHLELDRHWFRQGSWNSYFWLKFWSVAHQCWPSCSWNGGIVWHLTWRWKWLIQTEMHGEVRFHFLQAELVKLPWLCKLWNFCLRCIQCRLLVKARFVCMIEKRNWSELIEPWQEWSMWLGICLNPFPMTVTPSSWRSVCIHTPPPVLNYDELEYSLNHVCRLDTEFIIRNSR